MERLSRLRARIHSVTELLDVVTTMRAMAAVRLQQASGALAGARRYAEVIDAALGKALALTPPADWPTRSGDETVTPPAILLFLSEHGFVGALNEVLLGHAETAVAAGGPLFVVGSRGLQTVRERQWEAAWSAPMTSHRDGVPVLARRVAEELYRRFERDEIMRLDMLYARTGGGGRWQVRHTTLLPLDAAARSGADIPPLLSLPGPRLIERLAEEYVFAELAHAAMEALAGENAARLAAMSAARENIEKKLDGLRRTENCLRQDEITTELMDVVTGSEALLRAEASPDQ